MKDIITVHASETDPTTKFRDIDRRDRNSGYSKIGCHFLIEQDGTVHTGRDSLSASMYDPFKIANKAFCVLLIGGKNGKDNFSDAQWASIRALFETLLNKYGATFRLESGSKAVKQEMLISLYSKALESQHNGC